MIRINNLNVSSVTRFPSPKKIKKQYPVSQGTYKEIARHRRTISRILLGKDSRLLFITGPCSIHDEEEALAYARLLAPLAKKVQKEVFVVMRVFFAKPRTRSGRIGNGQDNWKGYIYDPDMNGSYDTIAGVAKARRIAAKIAALGLPIAMEVLDPFTIEYVSDLVSYGAIGARTSESQTHREVASGLSMPVGIKNSTDGAIENAVDGVVSARGKHKFLGIDQDGHLALVSSKGNASAHVILRGGKSGPNYDESSVAKTLELLKVHPDVAQTVVVDCSHGNSRKDFTKQPEVFQEVLRQREAGNRKIVGVMIESNLKPGNQKLPKPFRKSLLEYGVSVTDACIGWEDNERLVQLAAQS